MTLVAILWLHATGGFYGEHRGSWQLFEYPSLEACTADKPRRFMLAEGLGLHSITMECRDNANDRRQG